MTAKLALVLTVLNVALLAFNLTARAKAEVGGKDWFELTKDDDFRQAVGYIVSKCTVDIAAAPGLPANILCGR